MPHARIFPLIPVSGSFTSATVVEESVAAPAFICLTVILRLVSSICHCRYNVYGESSRGHYFSLPEYANDITYVRTNEGFFMTAESALLEYWILDLDVVGRRRARDPRN